MFDRLIESESVHEYGNVRRRYFMASTVIVGILFSVAVVVSIYASDYGIGGIEMVELIAPVARTETVPQPPESKRSQPAFQHESSVSALPVRKDVIARIDDHQKAPDTVSTAAATALTRPDGAFRIGNADVDPPSGGGTRPGSNDSESGGLTPGPGPATEQVSDDKPPAPAPVKTEIVAAKPIVKSLGVINGMATDLPKPPYTAIAKAARASGKVDVQVLIDEKGRVVSANALNGHPLLQAPAVQAARNAKFTPTYLSNVPVKVRGVIVYNFSM